jgi:micrococcal nuclease
VAYYRRRRRNGLRPSGWWYNLRPWLGTALLIVAIHQVNRWWQPPLAELKGTRFTVAQTFHRCGKGRGPNCVPDGDTFIMGKRHIRITSIDAPEVGAKAGCPLEAQQAEQAGDLLVTMLNQGPVILQPPQDGLLDQYGRELMTVTRRRADGSVQNIADDLVATGLVHLYDRGHPRGGWC